MLIVIPNTVRYIEQVKTWFIANQHLGGLQRLKHTNVAGQIRIATSTALVFLFACSSQLHAQDYGLQIEEKLQTVTTDIRGSLVTESRGGMQTIFTPPSPQAMRAIIGNRDTVWQAASNLVAERTPVRSTYDCTVDFNDEDAINLFVDKAASTFAYFPFWNQVCNVDVSVNVRPYYIDHFHLSYEKDVCIDTGSGEFGEMQEDASCMGFADPAKEARRLSSMLPRDVLELTAYNNYYDTRIDFDLKRIRVVGNRPVRVCYKPAEQNDGDWVTTAVDQASNTGIWLCWNNLSTGYWDLSAWAGDVSTVRIMAADGQPNFAVDDILINAPPY